jgi:hypothetical protein
MILQTFVIIIRSTFNCCMSTCAYNRQNYHCHQLFISKLICSLFALSSVLLWAKYPILKQMVNTKEYTSCSICTAIKHLSYLSLFCFVQHVLLIKSRINIRFLRSEIVRFYLGCNLTSCLFIENFHWKVSLKMFVCDWHPSALVDTV